VALREILTITPALEQLLMKPAREITTDEIERVAMQDGMITMLEDGVLKAVHGETSIEEVFRVLG
jgi:type II secretory ATPase GspE/PulE/Tfp pilus assembly ATPase PilB-like protein